LAKTRATFLEGAEAWAAVFAITVQQGAFINLPLVMAGVPGDDFRDIDNPLNALSVWVSLGFVTIGVLRRANGVAAILRANLSSTVFMVLVVASALWSVHPDLTLRRGVGYVLTIMLAAYLAARYPFPRIMQLFSASFVISAISSVVFVTIFPAYGIMNIAELVGTWRGVYTHKEVLGPTMAAAVFVELYLLIIGNNAVRRILAWCLFIFLILMTRSATAVLVASFFICIAYLYFLARRRRGLGAVLLAVVLTAATVAGALLMIAPDFVLGLLGKDANLTGRSSLWPLVIELIGQRPVLGWGYRATWTPGDPTTYLIDQLTGNWGVTSSHNSWLEITLQTGIVGLANIVVIMSVALYRSAISKVIELDYRVFFFMLFAVVATAGLVIETIGQNQNICWLLLTLFIFGSSSERRISYANDVRRRSLSPT